MKKENKVLTFNEFINESANSVTVSDIEKYLRTTNLSDLSNWSELKLDAVERKIVDIALALSIITDNDLEYDFGEVDYAETATSLLANLTDSKKKQIIDKFKTL